jgi:hypothetical protein
MEHASAHDHARRRRMRRRTPGAAAALLAIAAAIAALYWWLAREPIAPGGEESPSAEQGADAPRMPTAAPVESPAEPAAPSEPSLPLPPLDASDTFLREQIGALSTHPLLAQWLAQSELASRVAASVDNLAEGRVPRAHMGFLRPREPFRVLGAEPHLRVDPASYARWDGVAEVVASVDAAAAAALYRRVEPLLQEAYAVLGYPDRALDARVVAAIDELLEAPILDASPPLVPHVKTYKWADPEIERLSPAQKLLLRMGPHHVATIQSKLRALRGALVPAAEDAWHEAPPSE